MTIPDGTCCKAVANLLCKPQTAELLQREMTIGWLAECTLLCPVLHERSSLHKCVYNLYITGHSAIGPLIDPAMNSEFTRLL